MLGGLDSSTSGQVGFDRCMEHGPYLQPPTRNGGSKAEAKGDHTFSQRSVETSAIQID